MSVQPTAQSTAFPERRAQIAWLALLAMVLHLCLFDGLRVLGLVGPDEPRYAAIAREMAGTGDWVTPRLHGKPWFEKPVLYYWAAAVFYNIAGDNEFAARAPSALAAAVTAIGLGWLAWRIYGWRAAVIAALLFPTTVAAVGFGRAATTDMLFTASLGLAMLAATRIVRPGRETRDADETVYGGANAPPRRRMMVSILWRCGFGAALGLAVLAKGPAAILLAGGSVGLWVLITRRWREGIALAHPAAVAAFAVIALPWYVLCAMRNPEFVDVFLISHNFQRFLTPVFRHEQPFWFFGPVILLALIPWTFLLFAPLHFAREAIRDGRMKWSASLFLACWAIFPVVFFSISKSKLPGYVLPAIPPIVLLLARGLAKSQDGASSTARWLLLSVSTVLIGLAGAAMLPATAAQFPHLGASAVRTITLLAGAGGLLTGVLALRAKNMASFIAAVLTVALLVGGLNRAVLPALDAQLSPRTAAGHLEASTQGVSVYQVHRAWHYGLNYYFHRELPEWSPAQSEGWVYTTEAGREQIAAVGFHTDVRARGMGKVILVRVSSGQ